MWLANSPFPDGVRPTPLRRRGGRTAGRAYVFPAVAGQVACSAHRAYQVRVAARDGASGHFGSAVRWIEIPDLSSRRLALSSLLVGLQTVEPEGTAAAPQVQFSVNHRFARNSRLRYMLCVYNAARGASSSERPNVVLRARVLRGGREVLAAPAVKLIVGQTDAARVPYAGEIPLDSLPAGRYTFEVSATD